jgi:uncharacterized protein (DUF58 family)
MAGKRSALLWGPFFIFLVAFTLHINQMFVMFCTLAFLAPVSYFIGRRKLEGLEVVRHSRSVMTAGEVGTVSLRLRNRTGLRRSFIAVQDVLPEGLESPDGAGVLVPDLPPGADEPLQYRLAARRRGAYQIGPLRLECHDFLGLYRFTRRLGPVAELLVYPQAVPMPNLWRPAARGVTPRRSRRRRLGLSGDFAGVRAYVPGDDLRRVDWKSSARQGRLTVIETENPETTEAVVILDLQRGTHVGRGERSTLEYGATLAASLAAEAENRGCVVGLVAEGARDHSVPAWGGPRQQLQILEALARAQDDGTQPLSAVISAHETSFPQGCPVAVISAGFSADHVAAAARLRVLGHPVTWFALVPHTFEPSGAARPVPGYEEFISALAVQGATIVRVHGDEPLSASLWRQSHRVHSG